MTVATNLGVVLVLGGARSGKSSFAEATLLDAAQGQEPVYIATGQAFDEEMRARVDAHRAQRDGQGWRTIEEPVDLAGALSNIPASAPVLIDCLTLWVSNLMLADADIAAASDAFREQLHQRSGPTVIVSNEVGLGIVPGTALGRQFRDVAGRLNQQIAAQADRVVFVAAGLPLELKAQTS